MADDRDLDAMFAETEALFAAAVDKNAKRTSRAPAITAAVIPFGKLSSAVLDDGRTVVSTLCEQAGIFALTADSIIEDVIHAVETLAGLMAAAKLDGPRRETARVRVLQHCRAANIKDARSLVDSVLKAKTEKVRTAGPNPITLTDEEPWPVIRPVGELLDETAALVRRHVVLSDARADTIALWLASAYAIDAMSLMPILLVTAATMRSGKTTLLTVLGAILPRALAASNLTGAVLARAIAAFHPTLLADEADTWLTDEASELRGIMNAGHTRATAFVLRCAPDTHDPMLIPCFGARVIAMIRRPPSTIADRSITIELRRKMPHESVERVRVDRLHQDCQILRRQWRRWAIDTEDAVREIDPSMPAGLHDRATDNWRPLIGIADLAGGTWPARARAAASDAVLAEDDGGDESIGIELLRDVQVVFEEKDQDGLAAADLASALVALPERPWAEWSSGKPMTSLKLGRRLHPFGIKTRKVRQGSRTVNTYFRVDFSDAWGRYLPTNAEHAEHSNETGPQSEVLRNAEHSACSAFEKRHSVNESGSVPHVPHSNRVSGDVAEKTEVDRDRV